MFLASLCFALHLAEVHKHVLNTLIALIITFGWMSHGKMPLESHFEEARAFLAAVIISALDMPEHWYAPMLPADHPSSFCKLSGLTTEELNLVMEASGFVVKHGKNSMHHDVVMQSSSMVMLIATTRGDLLPRAWEEGQMCAGLNIHFYIDMNMFI
jgi:hypothetical protein